MTEEATCYLDRARTALTMAQQTIQIDPLTAANRAYYAAFYSVTALLVIEQGKSFKRRSAVEAAVYRNLAHTGRWPEELGRRLRSLGRLRTIADYEVMQVVSAEQAQQAVIDAEAIVSAVEVEIRPA